MSIPTHEALRASTQPPSNEYRSREYRVTGTNPPPPTRTTAARRTTVGIENSTLFWITLAAHGLLIGIELYLAHRAGWI